MNIWKRSITVVYALTILFNAAATSLNPEEALQRFLSDSRASFRIKSLQSPGDLRMIGSIDSPDGSGPALYLFSEKSDNGLLIISADDLASPLLGYLESKTEPGLMPPQLEWWLDEYSREISAAREAEKAGRISLQESARQLKRPQREPIAPLLTTKWNQSAPFNNLCPVDRGKLSYTGCTATAMAQIMKFFNYPEKGTGTGTATVRGDNPVTMNLDVTFEWDKMLDSYNGTYTEDEANAVATLMKACGFSLSTDYSSVASAAWGNSVPGALTENFSYDDSAQFLYRQYFGLSEWEQAIYENLKNYGPVYYDGAAQDGAHAFVCDGYSSDGYFHFNWGWGGNYDGYFLLTALNPKGQGIGGYSGGYNSYQGAIIGIHKPDGTVFNIAPRLSLELTGTALLASVGGTTLKLYTKDNLGGWWNYTGRTINYILGIRFTNINDPSDVNYIDKGETTSKPSYGFSSFTCNLKFAGLTEGEVYRVEPVTKADADSEWMEAYVPVGRRGYVLVKKNGTKYEVSEPEPLSLTLSNLKLESPIYYNEPCQLGFTVTNPNDEELMRTVYPALLRMDAGSIAIFARGDSQIIDLEGKETENRKMIVNFYEYSDDFVIGEKYRIALIDEENYEIIGYTDECTVGEAPKAGLLRVNSFSLQENTLTGNCSDVHFDANVTLDTGYTAEPLYVIILDKQQQGTILTVGGSDVQFMEQGHSYSFTVSVDMSSLERGRDYYAKLCRLNNITYTPVSKTIVFSLSSDTFADYQEYDDESEPVYYNIQGLRVKKPEKGEILIERKGRKASLIRN